MRQQPRIYVATLTAQHTQSSAYRMLDVCFMRSIIVVKH